MKQFLLFFFMLMPIVVNADTIEIDGIFYNLITKGDIGEVVSNPDHYSGSIVIPTSVSYEGKEYKITTINGGAFRSCQELTSITIPNSITSIGGSAFQNCTGLTSITIPESVKIIDRDTFYDCKNLVTVNLPDNLTIIGSSSFVGCTSLTSIALPDSLTTINGSAFYGCTSLSSVTFGKNLESIGVESFGNCPLLSSIHISDLEAWLNVKFYDLFRTPYHLFLNGTEIKDLVIPDGIKDLKNPSFSRCIGLTSVTIPNSVETIGDGTFSGTGLTSIVLPNSVTEIRTAFSGCKELSSVVLGNNVRWVGASAFAGCVKLEKVYCYSEVVPNTEANAFDGSYPQFVTLYVPKASISSYKARVPWSNFKEIKAIDSEPSPGLKRTIHVAQAGTLSDYINEEEINQIEELTLTGEINGTDFKTIRRMLGAPTELPSNYSEYSDGWGDENMKLRSLDISGVRIVAGGTYLENHEDAACDLHLNESDIIPARVFDGCKNLVSIAIPDNVNFIGSFALRGTAWYDAQPDGLVYLGKVLYAYKGNGIPSNITIEDGTLGIAGNAFAGMPIESVTIPESVTRIGGGENPTWGDLSRGFIPYGKGAFYDCDLQEVISMIENPFEISTETFSKNTFYNATLYVPEGTIDRYKTTVGWNKFVYIEEGTGNQGSENSNNGTCGENLKWAYNEDTKTLTISGTGKMDNYFLTNKQPSWSDFRNNIQSLVIEDGVTTIGTYAFDGCDGITSVTIPSSVTSIGDHAFQNCVGLTSVNISDLSAWCNVFFADMRDPEIKIFKDWFGISNPLVYAKHLYLNGEEIKELVIPDNITSISNFAFTGSSLLSITIPDNVKSIGLGAFWYCSELSTVTLPSGITVIENGAFAYCGSLRDVYCLAEIIPSTGSDTFSYWSIQDAILHVPANSVAAYKSAEPWSLFKEIVAITQEIVKEEVVYEIEGGHAQVIFSGNASGDVKIEAFVVIDDKEFEVTVIAKDAFKGCTEMLSAELPNTITSIGESAFEGCTGLNYFKVGNGIMEILSRAFANISSSSMTTRGGNDEGLHFYCLANAVPNTAADAFEETDIANATLHVPDNLVEQYKVSAPWSGFGTIVGISGTGITEISNDTQDGVIYNLNGNRLKVMSKGINLIRQKDGRVIKVLKK